MLPFRAAVSDKEKALAFKNEGNQAFAKRNFELALEGYNKAIELDDSEPTYYANRAQAYLKTEAYGYTIADATKAIELKPEFIKVSTYVIGCEAGWAMCLVARGHTALKK